MTWEVPRFFSPHSKSGRIFPIGIPRKTVTPIIQNERELFNSLERVTPDALEKPISDEELIAHILENSTDGALVVVNTTKAARSLYDQLSSKTTALHLSARMCPGHATAVLDKVRELRKNEQPVVLVSTQIIEAGVDVSFPVVYRAECGIDSFAQAAGRCNRNGECVGPNGEHAKGRVFLFSPADHPIPKGLAEIATAAAITRNDVMENFSPNELLSLDAIRTYFEQAIWSAGQRTRNWDEPGIVSGSTPCFNSNPGGKNWAQNYAFKTAAQRFRMIDSATHSVFISWNDDARKLENEIRLLDRQGRSPNRTHYRRAQAHTVQVYEHEWKLIQPRLSSHADGAFAILEHVENDYDSATGLKPPDASDNPTAFIL